MYRRLTLIGGLWGCAAPLLAADPVGAVPSAHGPMLMLYFSQPLGSHASPIYGLRLNQKAFVANVTSSAGAPIPPSPHSLIDLQLRDVQMRRSPDLRVEFGDRVAWDLRRREFELSDNQATKPLQLTAHAN